MMTKYEHIEYWMRSSDEDWITALSLFKEGLYVHSLFFAHLDLEKICKTYWIKYNESNIPPKIHNLVRLLKESKQEFNIEDLAFLEKFNDF
jgi:HEPN domain-containing protein